MAIAFVQTTARFTASAASSVVSGTLTTTAGNTGAPTVSTWIASGSVAPTVTDSKGNTATIDQSTADGRGKPRASEGSIPLTSAGASHSWTINFAAGTYCEGNVSEFSGLTTTPFDVSAGNQYNTSPGTTSLAVTTATTTQADELVIACIVTNNNDTTTNVSDPPTGYTSIGVRSDDTVTIGYEAAYKIVSATGAQTATWTFDALALGDLGGAAVVATYKAATTDTNLAGQARQQFILGLGA